MDDFTWKYVNGDGNPKRSGTYLVAIQSSKTATLGDYKRGKWYFHGYETENGGALEMEPYAWAPYPKVPEQK